MCGKGEGSPTASKSRTPSVKSCLKYEILCCYRDSDSILVLVPKLTLNCSCTKVRMKSDVPLRICIIKLWKPHKTRSCGKEAIQTRRIHVNCSCTNIRMKSDVLLPFGFVLRELWKPNKTRSFEKEAIQTRRIHVNCSCTNFGMKSDVLLPFGFVLSELWKPNKTRSCGKEAIQNQENPCKLLLHKRKNEIRCSAPLWICIKRVVEAKQNQELWERIWSHTKPCKLLLHKRKNEI